MADHAAPDDVLYVDTPVIATGEPNRPTAPALASDQSTPIPERPTFVDPTPAPPSAPTDNVLRSDEGANDPRDKSTGPAIITPAQVAAANPNTRNNVDPGIRSFTIARKVSIGVAEARYHARGAPGDEASRRDGSCQTPWHRHRGT